MPGRTTSFLRLLAATLVIGSGTGRVASLWFRELNAEAVASMLVGAVYLIIGIGLCGQSRFTLFVAVAVSATISTLLLYQQPFAAMHPAQQAAVAVDGITVLCCLAVLWQMHKPAAD